jgi:hypothetical protein
VLGIVRAFGAALVELGRSPCGIRGGTGSLRSPCRGGGRHGVLCHSGGGGGWRGFRWAVVVVGISWLPRPSPGSSLVVAWACGSVLFPDPAPRPSLCHWRHLVFWARVLVWVGVGV